MVYCLSVVEKLILALLAQLDRVFGYEPKGRGFESLIARHVGMDFASFLLFRKMSRSVRLFVCKRTHDGSRSLPTFCEQVPYGARGFSGQPSALQWTLLHSDFSFSEKSVITLRHPSFFAKGHARFACSFASALTTALGRYQPFACERLTAQGVFRSAFRIATDFACSDFLFYKKSVTRSNASSSFAKCHARFACSFASALTTALGCCQSQCSLIFA